MDTIFADATIKYRAIDSAVAHHAAYIFIIAVETLTAILCWTGAWQLFQSRHLPAAEFNRRKHLAVVGLTLGFLYGDTAKS